MPLIQRYPASKQFIKFCIIGTSNTILDFGIYLALTRTIIFFREHFLFANAISFSIAVTWSYALNRKWTFRNTHNAVARQFMLFLVINVVALTLNQLLLYSFVTYAGLYDVLAKALAVGIILFWNFFANRAWTFRSHNTEHITHNKNQDTKDGAIVE